jgi:hypothetical protein
MCTNFWLESLTGTDHLEENIKMDLIGNWLKSCGLNLSDSGYGPITGSC